MLDFVQLGANVGDDETDVVWPLLRGVPADTSKEHGATTPPASTDPAFVPIHRIDDPYFVLKRCSEGQYDTVFEKRF